MRQRASNPQDLCEVCQDISQLVYPSTSCFGFATPAISQSFGSSHPSLAGVAPASFAVCTRAIPHYVSGLENHMSRSWDRNGWCNSTQSTSVGRLKTAFLGVLSDDVTLVVADHEVRRKFLAHGWINIAQVMSSQAKRLFIEY